MSKRIAFGRVCLLTFNAAAAHPQTASVCLQGRLAGKLVSRQVAKNKRQKTQEQDPKTLRFKTAQESCSRASITHDTHTTHTHSVKGLSVFLLTEVTTSLTVARGAWGVLTWTNKNCVIWNGGDYYFKSFSHCSIGGGKKIIFLQK